MVLKSGATLVRQWRGHTHTVLVREDGFEYEGQLYRSLTVIAEQITGHIGRAHGSLAWAAGQNQKIACGRKHSDTLGVDYDVVTSLAEVNF